MIGDDVELENRLRQAAPVFINGIEPPATLHARVMSRVGRPARVRTALVRELALATALLVFVGLLGFGFSKLHKSPPNLVKPTPHAKSGIIPWTADPMVLFPASAEVMTPADAASRIARTATGVGTVLVPRALSDGYQAQLVASAAAFTVDYLSNSAHATISLSTPGMVFPASQRGLSTRSFRGVAAAYRVDDVSQPAGPRSLSWLEPGTTGAATSYSLMSDGLSESDFWAVANSLQVPSLPVLRPCAAANLHAVLGHPNGAGGQLFNSVYFTNHSATPCQLDGTPRVLIEDTTGHLLPLPQTSMGATGGPASTGPVDLPANSPDADPFNAPSTAGIATLIFSMWDCPANPTIRRVLIGLPHNGGTFSLPAAGVSYSWGGACEGAHVARMEVDPFTSTAPQPVYVENAPLAVTVQLADAPRAGSALRYEVTLTNASAAPFHFHECPSYTEFAMGVGGKTLENYSLNCAQVRWLAPDASVTFAMVIQIPTGTVGERGVLHWDMRSPYGSAQGSAPMPAVQR